MMEEGSDESTADEDAVWSGGEPASMDAIGRALQLDSVAPQWSIATDGDDELPQRLEPLRADELAAVESAVEDAHGLSELERELLAKSVASLNYVGNWADRERPPSDSIVLCCSAPDVHEGEGGPEYTCTYDDFTAERSALHSAIVERMLTSERTRARDDAVAAAIAPPLPALSELPGSGPRAPLAEPEPERAASGGGPVCPGGPSALMRDPPSRDAQHVFFVVGVPGSGKDTVLKRYLRSLGLPLLDASADLIKEYLAAWGQDELSNLVRDNNAHNGPGKHLLHAQYLHRESILICDLLVQRALASGMSIMLEKTLFNLEGVLSYVRDFRARGCVVHLLGTHIQPLANWRFLETRMASGQAFGRYISKEQALTGLTRYQQNLEAILDEPELADVFDSVHVYDVMASRWCVSKAEEPSSPPPSPSQPPPSPSPPPP